MRATPPRRTTRLLLTALLVGAAACTTRGPRRRTLNGTRLTHLGGVVGVDAEIDRVRRDGRITSELAQIRERAGVQTRGSVYHPRFLKFAAATTLGFVQQRWIEPRATSDSESYLDYDVNLELFQKHLVPFSLFALRQEDFTAGRDAFYRGRTEQHGGEVRTEPGALRASLRYTDTETESDGLFVDRTEWRERLAFRAAHRDGKGPTTELRADWEELSERPFARDYETRQASFTHVRDRNRSVNGPRYYARTYADWWERTGTEELERSRLQQSVGWWITDRLRSRTAVGLYRNESRSKSEGKRVSQSLQHQLYSSLTTTLSGARSWSEVESGSIDGKHTAIEFRYDKRTFFGKLELRGGTSISSEDNDVESGFAEAIREQQTLATGTTTLLDSNDVDHTSVVVRDAVTAQTYTRGVDYRLDRRGRRTELVRIPTGLIPDGGAVLVDYRYALRPGRSIETRSQRTSQRLSFGDTLRIYSRQSRSQDRVKSGDYNGPLEDTRAFLWGSELTLNGFRAYYEYEDEDSRYSPMTSTRLGSSYGGKLGPRTDASVGYSEAHSDFSNGSFDGRYYSVDVGHSFTDALHVSCRAVYRVEELDSTDNGGRDERFLDVFARLGYRYGKLEFAAEIDHRAADRDMGESDVTEITLSVERRW